MNRPKQTGTSAETTVLRYLTAQGLPNVARRTLTGSQDTGDVWIDNGWAVLEVKSRNRPHTWADVEAWLTELDREAIHAERAGAAVCLSALVVKRIGSGARNAADWHVYLRPDDATYLLSGVASTLAGGWMSTTLGHFAALVTTRMNARGPFGLLG